MTHVRIDNKLIAVYKTLKNRNNITRRGASIVLVLGRRKTNSTNVIISEKLLRYYFNEERNMFDLYEKDKSSVDTTR